MRLLYFFEVDADIVVGGINEGGCEAIEEGWGLAIWYNGAFWLLAIPFPVEGTTFPVGGTPFPVGGTSQNNLSFLESIVPGCLFKDCKRSLTWKFDFWSFFVSFFDFRLQFCFTKVWNCHTKI